MNEAIPRTAIDLIWIILVGLGGPAAMLKLGGAWLERRNKIEDEERSRRHILEDDDRQAMRAFNGKLIELVEKQNATGDQTTKVLVTMQFEISEIRKDITHRGMIREP